MTASAHGDGAVRAAVDVGTNSVRLLVVGADGAPLARLVEITRLGRGVDATGHLDDESLATTLSVLGQYRTVWESHGAAAVRIAATSAVRDATDRQRFFDGVREVTGVHAEVLTGGVEAETAFKGCMQALGLDGGAIVVDIGGGSTELIVGHADAAGAHVRAACSLQLGSVRLTERCFVADPPASDEVLAARHEIQDRLVEGIGHLDEQGGMTAVREATTLVGVAGTVTTLAMQHLGLTEWRDGGVHGIRLDVETVNALADRLTDMTVAQRRELPGMPAGRADVIAAGALILAEALEAVSRLTGGRIVDVLVSEADILDGLAASL